MVFGRKIRIILKLILSIYTRKVVKSTMSSFIFTIRCLYNVSCYTMCVNIYEHVYKRNMWKNHGTKKS